ncbi:Fur family transcriptional regulator [Escherichia coli]|uniref:Fur family transcriptional regulator n=1 Tax=Escherichia coli TaxID=562 RepID=UPI003F7560E2
MICDNCGKIVDFHQPGLEEVAHLASHVTGFEVNSHRLEVYGTCPDCAAGANKAK